MSSVIRAACRRIDRYIFDGYKIDNLSLVDTGRPDDSYILNGYDLQLRINRGGSDGLSYMPGFGNDFETESLARRAAAGPELAAAPRLRALCRAAFRLALHRAARHQ